MYINGGDENAEFRFIFFLLWAIGAGNVTAVERFTPFYAANPTN